MVANVANATLISFDNIPTDNTYINDGLLLSSSTGGYTIGGCANQTAGSNGCLGNSAPNGFGGGLTFTFVNLGTTTQSVTNGFEIILCEGCGFRGTTASVFDALGGLLTTIDMNTDSGLGNRTFSYFNTGIGSIFVNLGSGLDAVQSLEFTVASVPVPSIFLMFGLGLGGLGYTSRNKV